MRLLSAPLLAAVLATLACNPPPGGPPAKKEKTGTVVATVAGQKVTVEDLQKKLEEQSPFVRARYAEPEKKKELLDGQVRFEVLAAEAKSRGFADDPEVEEAIKKIIVQRLTREEFDGRVQLKDVTDKELETYFNDHKGDYQKPEMVRASFVAITHVAGDADAKKTADDVQKAAADPKKKTDRNAWKDLVTKYSTDEATKPAAGDLRYLSRADALTRFGAPAAEWLFASDEQDAVSGVFAIPDGYAVFKRTGKRKAIERTFDQVKNQIKNVVYREKRTAAFNTFVEDLRKKYDVKTFPEKLDQLKIDVNPAAVNQLDDGHGHGMPGMPGTPGVPGTVDEDAAPPPAPPAPLPPG